MSDTAQSSLWGEDAPLSVSQLNREARFLLEGHFPAILVEGEISNFARPASGHWYFTLKDENAQVRCAMFRNRNLSVRFRPQEGSQVLLKAKLSLYEGRGDYQLIVEKMEEMGDGALRRAFEALKDKLLLEGLFDEASKQEIPAHPRHIGVITSPTGAAIRDILSVLKRRFPAIEVTILPVSVQGKTAAGEMVSAIALANQKQGCLKDLDVLIVGRGGGSLEDLWSFNDEALARAIYKSKLPIISAVGHEVDFTISDFVADLRAATPSAAAELLSPDQAEYQELFQAYALQFQALIKQQLAQSRQQLSWLSKGLKHPGRRLQEQAQRLDDQEKRLRLALKAGLFRQQSRLRQLHAQLLAHTPLGQIRDLSRENRHLGLRLKKALRQLLAMKQRALIEQSNALNMVNPLNILSRGYAIVYGPDGRQIISRASQLNAGDQISTRLHEGKIFSTVDRLETKDKT